MLSRYGPTSATNTMKENEIAEGIVEAAFRVHRELGPGLL